MDNDDKAAFIAMVLQWVCITGGVWLLWDWRAAVLAFGITLLIQERWQ